MKKIICLVLVLCALVCSLTSCAVVEGILFGLFAAGTSEAGTKVEEMVAALSEGRDDDALEFMHPSVRSGSETGIANIIEFINGRKPESIQQTGYFINTQVGLVGSIVQEQITYNVVFTDGTAIGVDVIFLTNIEGQGFSRFMVGSPTSPAPTTPEGGNDNGANDGETI